MQSWVLARLDHETRLRHAQADNDRLCLMTSHATEERYRKFLERVFGFEAPVESALQMTPGLDEIVDLRARVHLKLLKCDLVALGRASVNGLPRCRAVFPFRSVEDALGWMYVIERNMLLHGLLRRHLEPRLPAQLAIAGSYLTGNERAVGARMRELAAVLDGFAKTPAIADRIVAAAHAAFRCQRHWFAEAVPPRVQVA